ncbi:hypothetical protein BH11ARM2_BH11ARM2_23690 [soil metagenome]
MRISRPGPATILIALTAGLCLASCGSSDSGTVQSQPQQAKPGMRDRPSVPTHL